jgi:hypothetical protein
VASKAKAARRTNSSSLDAHSETLLQASGDALNALPLKWTPDLRQKFKMFSNPGNPKS